MERPRASKPRGILKTQESLGKSSHARILASPDLRFFVEHFWIIKWDLTDQESVQGEVLPHPSIHFVFEMNNTKIAGVATGKFTRIMEGKGGVLGIKFRPGAFYPFVRIPISEFTDKVFNPWEVLDVDRKTIVDLEDLIFSQTDDEKGIEFAEEFLRERLPEEDENVETVNRIVKLVLGDQTIIKVDDLAERCNIGKRALQRLFTQYVGVSPKWVIKRYRLHEALEQLSSGEASDLTKLAMDLGYFDQAHFIKDFKAMVGKPPAAYAKNSR
jgi:AraC-like DNA-binding protein